MWASTYCLYWLIVNSGHSESSEQQAENYPSQQFENDFKISGEIREFRFGKNNPFYRHDMTVCLIVDRYGNDCIPCVNVHMGYYCVVIIMTGASVDVFDFWYESQMLQILLIFGWMSVLVLHL